MDIDYIDKISFIVNSIILITFLVILAYSYKKCPQDKALVVYGYGLKKPKYAIGKGTFVIPLIQNYEILSLEPMSISINLKDALSYDKIGVSISAVIEIAFSSEPEILQNAGLSVLELSKKKIIDFASDIIISHLRFIITKLTTKEIDRDRRGFVNLIRRNLDDKLNKLGLFAINVSVNSIIFKTFDKVQKYIKETESLIAIQKVYSGKNYSKEEYEQEQKRLIIEKIARIINEKIVKQ